MNFSDAARVFLSAYKHVGEREDYSEGLCKSGCKIFLEKLGKCPKNSLYQLFQALFKEEMF